jgi:hypothetical protein
MYVMPYILPNVTSKRKKEDQSFFSPRHDAISHLLHRNLLPQFYSETVQTAYISLYKFAYKV